MGALFGSLGCSPLDDGFYHSPPDCRDLAHSIQSLTGFGTAVSSPSPISALPLCVATQRYTSIYFGENQLSLGLIGLSPLSTTHPKTFQRQRVRSSTSSYTRFNLVMDRSPSFGSTASDLTPYSDSLSLRLGNNLTLPDTITRRLIMQKAVHHTGQAHGALNDCKQTVSGSISLRYPRFFSPFPHGTGSLSVWK